MCWAGKCFVLSLSLQSLFSLLLSWEIAEVVSPCLPRGLWSHIVIRAFFFLGTVCPRHLPYPAVPSCPLLRAFPYPQPGNVGGRRSAPAVCQSLTSADPTKCFVSSRNVIDGIIAVVIAGCLQLLEILEIYWNLKTLLEILEISLNLMVHLEIFV